MGEKTAGGLEKDERQWSDAQDCLETPISKQNHEGIYHYTPIRPNPNYYSNRVWEMVPCLNIGFCVLPHAGNLCFLKKLKIFQTSTTLHQGGYFLQNAFWYRQPGKGYWPYNTELLAMDSPAPRRCSKGSTSSLFCARFRMNLPQQHCTAWHFICQNKKAQWPGSQGPCPALQWCLWHWTRSYHKVRKGPVTCCFMHCCFHWGFIFEDWGYP